MLAKALADLARTHSMDSNFDSPYSLEAVSKVITFVKTKLLDYLAAKNSTFIIKVLNRFQGFDVPWWKKILGRKLTGMVICHLRLP